MPTPSAAPPACADDAVALRGAQRRAVLRLLGGVFACRNAPRKDIFHGGIAFKSMPPHCLALRADIAVIPTVRGPGTLVWINGAAGERATAFATVCILLLSLELHGGHSGNFSSLSSHACSWRASGRQFLAQGQKALDRRLGQTGREQVGGEEHRFIWYVGVVQLLC